MNVVVPPEVPARMDRVGPTNPFHISKAYGVAPPAPSQSSFTSVAKAAGIRPTQRTDAVDATTTRMAASKSRINNLVAARVSESPQTAATVLAAMKPATQSANGAFPMYRHPADKNAAATAINAGRVLDLNA